MTSVFTLYFKFKRSYCCLKDEMDLFNITNRYTKFGKEQMYAVGFIASGIQPFFKLFNTVVSFTVSLYNK